MPQAKLPIPKAPEGKPWTRKVRLYQRDLIRLPGSWADQFFKAVPGAISSDMDEYWMYCYENTVNELAAAWNVNVRGRHLRDKHTIVAVIIYLYQDVA